MEGGGRAGGARARAGMAAPPGGLTPDMSPEAKDKAFGMAKQEMEYRVELFNRLSGACFDKCVDKRFREGDLNVGESSCVDRCSAKYWQVVGIVGQMLGGAGAGGPGPPTA